MPRARTESEIRQFAAEENASDGRIIDRLDLRIIELERKVHRLEAEQSRDVTTLAEITRADAQETRAVNAELKRLSDNGDGFKFYINQLRSMNGWPAIPEKK